MSADNIPEAKCKLHSPEELDAIQQGSEEQAQKAAADEAAARAAENEVGEKFADDPESEDAKKARTEARQKTENALLEKKEKEQAAERMKGLVTGAKGLWTSARSAAAAAAAAAGKKEGDEAAIEEIFGGLRSEIEQKPATHRWTTQTLVDLATARAKGEKPPEKPEPGGVDPASVPGGQPPGGNPEDAADAAAMKRFQPGDDGAERDWMDGDYGAPAVGDNQAPVSAVPEARALSRAMNGIFSALSPDEAKKAGFPVDMAEGGTRPAVAMLSAGEAAKLG